MGFGVHTFARVDENQGDIGFGNGLAAAFDADLFDHVVGFAQAGGVYNVNGHAVEGDLFAHGVAGGAGDVGYDGDVVARQGVEQAGFADVGRADGDDVHAFAQNRALFRAGEDGFQTTLQCLELAARVGGFEKVDVFFGEVQRGFDQHPQGDEVVHQLVYVL